jgi:multicomponent K+:H+ antiporter subunit G
MEAPDLPLWATVIVAGFALYGAALTLLGTIGLVRLKTFYDRAHPLGLGLTMGNVSILIASIVCFSVLQTRPVVHEVLILIFVTLTTPVTMMLLARAALFRDRSKAYDQRVATEAHLAAQKQAAELEAAQREAALVQTSDAPEQGPE